MPMSPFSAAALVLALAAPLPALAGSAVEGWDWLDTTTDLMSEGIYFNDNLGDGQDRWRSGGLTQHWMLPETVWSDGNLFPGRATFFEVGVRALVITPDNMIDPADGDRPFAQYLAGGFGVRTVEMPREIGSGFTLSEEDRLYLEIGWVGAPLPLFEVQDMIHGASGTGGGLADRSNAVEGGFLVNLDARRTWRLHAETGAGDLQLAPFVHVAAGTRELSARIGGDMFLGDRLEGRLWGSDLSTGAVMPGGGPVVEQLSYAVWVGGDVGHVAHDGLMEGSLAGVDEANVTARLRTGLMVEHGRTAAAVSLNWLNPEFKGQGEGQLLGAVSLKYRF